ncbi:MAG TPA: PKD domain-containing protein [Anaerolineae bacterium]|nr:PKD domain-containing protein [Anaerolineae bacterium]
MPDIVLRLPQGLVPDSMAFPAGMSLNLQDSSLNWQPVLAAGSGQQFSLPLRVETADMAAPEKLVTAVIKYDDLALQADAALWVGIAPQIKTLLNPPQVAVGQPFQLQAETDGSGPISQTWYLGDGRRLDVNNPVVVYPAPGIYEIELKAANPLANVSQTSVISVVPHPAAQFSLDDNTPGVGQPVTFLNQSGGLAPLSVTWDFGDGSFSSELSPVHQYQTPGTYQIHLTVQNQYGVSEAFGTVTVGVPPVADLVVPDSIPAGESLSAQGFGDETVTRYEWYMGDGRSYEGETVNHTYTRTGDFYITLVAMNEFGGTEVGRWIRVEPGILRVYLPLIINKLGELLPDGAAAPPEQSLLPDLPDVALDQPFVLEPVALPPNSTPAEQLYIYINEARQQFGLRPLNNIPELAAAAAKHAADMGTFGFVGHTGSDGSTPAERYIQFGYGQGYAGEATAWGFEDPRAAVEFWVNSPAHRRIILNEFATDVGAGFTANVSSPNIWYWVAEFGNQFAQPPVPVLRVQQPSPGLSAMITSAVTYSWNWPAPLQPGQKFVIYLITPDEEYPAATVTQPSLGTLYSVQLAAVDFHTGQRPLQVMPGAYEWQVRLEQGGAVLTSGEQRPITFTADPDNPIITPTPDVTVTAVPPTPSPTPAVTPTPTTIWPTATPPPPQPTQPPPLVTATPNP